MEYLWMVAGSMSGWILVEFVVAATKTKIPILFNLALMFIGGLAGYTLSL